jgi:putative 4-mercaptohistidine N1-methyltranferase
MKSNPYETERYLHEYLFFHFARPNELSPFKIIPDEFLRFHERIRQECLLPIAKPGPIRALDLGCAVGRFTFELSRVADDVLGVDNSKKFILAARDLAKRKPIEVQMHESGNLFSTRRIALPKGVRAANVRFQVGDAQNLHSIAKQPFDLVAAINLICRLPSPRAFCRRLPGLISPGGQLVIASPFSWLKEYTPQREWLTSSDLRALLQPQFQLMRRRDLPFVIREHRRKYQLVVSEVLTFKRC